MANSSAVAALLPGQESGTCFKVDRNNENNQLYHYFAEWNGYGKRE